MMDNDVEPLLSKCSSPHAASSRCFPCSVSNEAKESLRPFANHFQRQKNQSHSKSVMTSSKTEESLRDDDKVPMDFTNSTARVISDPFEIQQCFKERERDAIRCITRSYSPDSRDYGNIMASYFAQPWFHPALTREETHALFDKHDNREGSYILRTSEHLPGCLVLCLAHNSTVLHFPVNYMKSNCWTLDGGHSKFRDLFQLIDFYQMNTGGVLPTTLDNFITVAVDIPSHSNLPAATSSI